MNKKNTLVNLTLTTLLCGSAPGEIWNTASTIGTEWEEGLQTIEPFEARARNIEPIRYDSVPSIRLCTSENLEDLPDSSKKSDADLDFSNITGSWENPSKNCYTATSQIVDYLAVSFERGYYGNIAACIYANAQSFGGGNFDKSGNHDVTSAAQEECEIRNFPGIYSAIRATGLVSQGEAENVLLYKKQLYDPENDTFRTLAVPQYPMRSLTSTKPSSFKAKHGQTLPKYAVLVDPIPVDLIFTAAPDLRKDATSTIDVGYIKKIIQMLRTQMIALQHCKSQTFITGPIGCGIFCNDPRVIALAYAYVLRYHRPETLKHIVFVGAQNFYGIIQHYYTWLPGVFPGTIPDSQKLLETFFPTQTDRDILWPDFSTKDPFMRQLFKSVSPDLKWDSGLKAIIGDPDPRFCSAHDGYGCGRMRGTSILHAFAHAHNPQVLAQLTGYGFDINHPNSTGRTPLDVYVECSGQLRRGNPDYESAKWGIEKLPTDFKAKCSKPENFDKLNSLRIHYRISPLPENQRPSDCTISPQSPVQPASAFQPPKTFGGTPWMPCQQPVAPTIPPQTPIAQETPLGWSVLQWQTPVQQSYQQPVTLTRQPQTPTTFIPTVQEPPLGWSVLQWQTPVQQPGTSYQQPVTLTRQPQTTATFIPIGEEIPVGYTCVGRGNINGVQGNFFVPKTSADF